MDPEQRVWRDESCYEQMSREMREELMRVRAENARLREALQEIVLDSTFPYDGAASGVLVNVRRTASKALKPPHGD